MGSTPWKELFLRPAFAGRIAAHCSGYASDNGVWMRADFVCSDDMMLREGNMCIGSTIIRSMKRASGITEQVPFLIRRQKLR